MTWRDRDLDPFAPDPAAARAVMTLVVGLAFAAILLLLGRAGT